MTNFFLQFKQRVHNISDIELDYLNALKLEDRAETWDYLDQNLVLSTEEKWKYYQENCILLNNFGSIVAEINQTNIQMILQGCRKTVQLLNILSIITDPQERFEIASYLLRLFDLIINSNLIQRVIALLDYSSYPHIQWEAEKIITFFAPGPRIAHTPEDSLFHPKKLTTKAILINGGAVQKLLALLKSPCLEVKEQALLALGFIARHDKEAKDVVITLKAVDALLSTLSGTKLDSVIKKATWTLSILCGATLPKDATLKSKDDMIKILTTVVTLLFTSNNPEVITNVIGISKYLLPLMEIKEDNMNVWERLVQMLSFPNHIIKRSALSAVQKILELSDVQTQFMIECGLLGQLGELLMNQNQDVRIDTCSALVYLARKGYSWVSFNLSNIVYNGFEYIFYIVQIDL